MLLLSESIIITNYKDSSHNQATFVEEVHVTMHLIGGTQTCGTYKFTLYYKLDMGKPQFYLFCVSFLNIPGISTDFLCFLQK